MLKNYLINGKGWLLEESEAPEGAIEVKAKKPEKKAEEPDVKVYKPANKTRKTAKK